MRFIVALLLLNVCALSNSVSAVWVETCGPNAVYRRKDETANRRNIFTDCWRTWSRCSRWSKAGSGTIWETCDECCKKKGHRSGQCNLRLSKCVLASKAYVCECQ